MGEVRKPYCSKVEADEPMSGWPLSKGEIEDYGQVNLTPCVSLLENDVFSWLALDSAATRASKSTFFTRSRERRCL